MKTKHKQTVSKLGRIQDYFEEINMGKFIIYMVLIAWAATTILPLLWVTNNSLKSSSEIIDTPFKIADSLYLDNYRNAIERANIFKSYLNSLIMSGSTVILVMLFGGMAAYALACFDFKLRATIQGLLAVGLLIPAFVTIIH